LTSRPLEILITLDRDSSLTFGAQIEAQIRDAVRTGTLRSGTLIASTRDLAQQLKVSRPIVVEAYAQLAAGGFLSMRQGARPRIADFVRARKTVHRAASEPTRPQFDFRPSMPDLSAFPRKLWLKAFKRALEMMSSDDLGYGQRHGTAALRVALAEYLGRVRGVVTDADRIVVASGFEQIRGLACHALKSIGANRIAVENPGYIDWEGVRRAGLEIAHIDVDQGGLRMDQLENSRADAVLLTPAHQFPTGLVMSGERRGQVLSWLRARSAFALEDDYDAEFRYDRAPVAALQSLDPERVLYAGTASKTLAPALRMGWLAVPQTLLQPIREQQRLIDYGCPRIEQNTLAEFLASGEFDRHLRRMRSLYRVRRDALLGALAAELPGAEVTGIAAGLHAVVRLPDGYSERSIRAAAEKRGIGLEFLSQHRVGKRDAAITLLLGYAQSPESTIRAGVRALAVCLREST
jgi:GntR family transcriptional regulator/MocR family aminotransferase